MKKIIIATLIICVVFCMLLSHKEYRNYKITNITLSEIVIKDSLLNLRKGNKINVSSAPTIKDKGNIR